MELINDIIKNHWGQIVALLSNYLKDIDMAEDAMQDAVESALVHWPKNGTPTNPEGWLFTTAKHKALDKIRRSQNFANKQQQYQYLLESDPKNDLKEGDYTIPDERLRLIFTCCHPALDSSVSVALTLRLLGGLNAQETANAFLVKTETMAQRLVRGKRKIKQAGIPYLVPEKQDFTNRLDTVLKVLYLIFNEGYSASSGDVPIRRELCKEAMRLAKMLLKLCPHQAEVKGLLSLMLLNDSRQKARFNQLGEFVPLDTQNRNLWNNQQIKQGVELIESALKQKQIGSYQLQASISAIHAEAKDYQSTNWHEIVLIYDEMLKISWSDVIKLNRLVALAQITDYDKVMLMLNELEQSLNNYQPFHAVKADLLGKIGDFKLARTYYLKAINLSDNSQIVKFLIKKKDSLPNI